MILLFCSLLAIGAIGFTLFVRERDIPPAPVENPELKHLETRRQVLYDNLKDLQFEFHQGKLSDGDYQSLKAGFLYDLAAVMDSIERQQALTGANKGAGSKAAATSGSKKKQKVIAAAETAGEAACPACGKSNSPPNRFCGHCGKSLF